MVTPPGGPLLWIGLWELEQGPTPFGSDEDLSISLPSADSPPLAGTLHRSGQEVRLEPANGADLRIVDGEIRRDGAFTRLVNPGRPIPKQSIRFHGITDEMVRGEAPAAEVLPAFHDFIEDAVLVAHNAAFDMKFLKLKESACGRRFDNLVLDTLLPKDAVALLRDVAQLRDLVPTDA